MKDNYLFKYRVEQYIFIHVSLEKCADEFGKPKVTYNDLTWMEQQLKQGKEIISAL